MFAFQHVDNSSGTTAPAPRRLGTAHLPTRRLGTAHHKSSRPPRGGFTLVELLVTISIIAILASLILVALYGAQEDAKISRTETQIAKIHELIMTKWEEYESRPVQLNALKRSEIASDPQKAALYRLRALRELQRMELPQLKFDVSTDPEYVARPALSSAYIRQRDAAIAVSGEWTGEHGRAECLYLIISQMRDGNRKALEYFSEDEIGDVDDDAMPEILDAWGNPIAFFRWAPGFTDPHSSFQFGDQNKTVDGDSSPDSTDSSIMLDPLGASSYDPFDPLRSDLNWNDDDPANDPFPLYPLIMSAGPDGEFGEIEVNVDSNSQTQPFDEGSGKLTGRVGDPDTIVDNIHNHFLIVR